MVLPCHVYLFKFNSRVSESRTLHGLGFPKTMRQRVREAEMRTYTWFMEHKQSEEESEDMEKGGIVGYGKMLAIGAPGWSSQRSV